MFFFQEKHVWQDLESIVLGSVNSIGSRMQKAVPPPARGRKGLSIAQPGRSPSDRGHEICNVLIWNKPVKNVGGPFQSLRADRQLLFVLIEECIYLFRDAIGKQ